MTKKKLIEKYERVLASRENQIEDLSSEIGTVNYTFYSIQINIQYYIMKNILFQNKFMKKEEIIHKKLKIKKF